MGKLRVLRASVVKKALPRKIENHGRSAFFTADGAGEGGGLSVEAESGGAGQGAWEISPAT